MALRLLYIAIILVAIVLGLKSWSVHSALSQLSKVTLGNSIGPEDADKVLIEIMDYRCSYCRQMHLDMLAFHRNNPDVKIIFRHYPVLGKVSLHDAQLALSAGMQGKFEVVHNRLMEKKREINDGYLQEVADEFDLDFDQLKKTLKGPEIGNELLTTIDNMKTLKIDSIPTFIANGIVFTPTERLPTEQELETLMNEAYR